MESVALNLTPGQMERLAMGGAIMVAPEMVGGAVQCTISGAKKAKMMKNHAVGKKFRLTMDPQELKGGSFKSFLRKLKRGYQKYVRPRIGPKIRKGLKEAAHGALEIPAAMTGSPEAVNIAKAIATELEGLVDWLGNKTGAFGMRPPRRRVMM